MMKDKGFKILFGIYLLTFAADLFSTLIMGEKLQYLESNPLYIKFGGLAPIILLNIAVAGLYYWIYKKGSINARFVVVFSVVAIIMTRLIAIRGNISVYQNPPTLQQAMAVTQAMKTEAVKKLAAVNIFPFFNGLVAWLFFKWDHIIMGKNGQKIS